jgi:hypothetical protein
VRRRKKRTVQEALTNHTWISDIQGALTVDFLLLWDLLSNLSCSLKLKIDTYGDLLHMVNIPLYQLMRDYFRIYSFRAMGKDLEDLAPPKCPFFLWLVAHNRCWTADRLARRGLPHPERCPLCNQAAQTIDHLLILCVFTREFWFRFLSQVGLQSPTDLSFFDWWDRVSRATSDSDIILQGINSLIILGAWTVWTHRNRCVFNGAAPDHC